MIERYEGGVKLVFNSTKDLLEYETSKKQTDQDVEVAEEACNPVYDAMLKARDNVRKSDQWDNTKLKTSHNNYILHGKLQDVLKLYGTMKPSAISRELGLKKSTVLSYISLLRRKKFIE
jgi:hypothetical protein